MQTRVGTMFCKFAGDPVMFVVEEAIVVTSEKCPYHATFDLEHILDVGSSGDHRVQVWWRSSHLPSRRSDLRKSLQTDGRTDRPTTDAARLHTLME